MDKKDATLTPVDPLSLNLRMAKPSEWRFPMPCPSCTTVAGVPVRELTCVSDRLVYVGVRCKVCSHEWQLVADAPDIVLKVQPDRRKKPRA